MILMSSKFHIHFVVLIGLIGRNKINLLQCYHVAHTQCQGNMMYYFTFISESLHKRSCKEA